jgi:hypothetical protein
MAVAAQDAAGCGGRRRDDTMKHQIASTVFAGTLVLGLAGAFADSSPLHLKGEIDDVAGQSFDMTAIDGSKDAVAMTATTRITSLKPAQLSDITQGMFVGTAAMPQADGTLKALEIHIFPENLRGTGEGYRPFPQVAHSTMTNATVTNIVATQTSSSDGGKTLTLTYKDGHQTVVVPAGIPIVLIGPGEASMLQPHAKISVTATKDASGKLTASRILVGLGVTPPI